METNPREGLSSGQLIDKYHKLINQRLDPGCELSTEQANHNDDLLAHAESLIIFFPEHVKTTIRLGHL